MTINTNYKEEQQHKHDHEQQHNDDKMTTIITINKEGGKNKVYEVWTTCKIHCCDI